MALLDDLTKDITPTGLALSIGTVLLAPVLVPAVSGVLRPVAKGVLSTGIQLYRQAAEPVGRAMSGLVAEAQLELASAKAAGAAAPPASQASATEIPATEIPVTEAPVTEAPVTEAAAEPADEHPRRAHKPAHAKGDA